MGYGNVKNELEIQNMHIGMNMRFFMKKAMFFYLTLLFSVFFLSACADEISIYVETPTAPQRNESLSVFYIGEQKDSKLINAALTRYQELYPDVEVELVRSEPDATNETRMELYNQVAAQIMAGEGPDIFIIHDTVMDVEKLVRQGIFADMEPFFEADNFNWDPYNKTIMAGGMWNGRRYVIPLGYRFPLLITSRTALEETGFIVDACKDYMGFLEETMRFMEDTTQTRRLFYGTVSVLDVLDYSDISIADYDARTIDLSSPLLRSALSWQISILKKDQNWAYDITGGMYGAAAIRDGQALWTTSLKGPLYSFYNDFGALKTLGEAVMMPIRDVNGGIQAKIDYPVAVRANSENLQNAYNLIKILLSPDVQYAVNLQQFSVLNSANEYFYRKAARGDTHFAMAGTNDFVSTVDSYYAVDCPTTEEFQQLIGFTQEITGTYYSSHLDLYGAMSPFVRENADYEDAIKSAQQQLEIYISE